MSHTAHIFIGKELSSFCEDVAGVISKQNTDAIPFNHLYLFYKDIQEYYKCSKIVYPSQVGEGVMWDNSDAIKLESLSRYWSDNIFDNILTIDTNQDNLNVFIHFSLLSASAYEIIRPLCASIKQAQRPSVINFIAYGGDLSKFIEKNADIDYSKNTLLTASQAHLKVKDLYSDFKLTPHINNLILLQNRTTNGVSILNDEDGNKPFCDMIGNLLLLLSLYYDRILPHTTGANQHELLGLGFSSLFFDKYLFVNYLLQKVFLKAIDNQSVNVEFIDVNIATEEAKKILQNKLTIFSNFLGKDKGTTSPNDDGIAQEVNDIFQRVLSYIEKENNIPLKAAVLATILSQVDCNLFESSYKMLDNQCYEELYAEVFNFFIDNDDVGYYKICGEKPINSIDELKKVNRKLVQAEAQIRTLEKQLDTYSAQIDLASHVEDCLIDDGYFIFNDKKFRLLPNFDEEPLKDSYEAHDVSCESVDLRSQFSCIKDQGQQGSCLSFALTSIFEYMMKTNLKEDCDLSEAFLYYNARNLDDNETVNEDNGSRFHPSIESLSKYGIALEKLWPYNDNVYSTRPSEQAYEDAATRKLVKALNVERSVYAIKSALADGYPVAGSFVLYPSFFSNNGYVSLPTQAEIEERKNAMDENKKIRHSCHAMVIVGYSDKLQMFIVRNSWGTSWGERGYCYMPYEYVTNPTLFEFACIFSEVTSLKHPKVEMINIPQLKIDASDIVIRYYIALASLNKQKVIVKELRDKRLDLQTYCENQKSIYSDSNERDSFIEANEENLRKRNDELVVENKKLDEEVGELHDIIAKKKKVVVLDSITAVLLSVVLLLSSMIKVDYWWFWFVIAAFIGIPYVVYVGKIFRKNVLDATIKITSAVIVTAILLPIVIFAEGKFDVWWKSTLFVTIPFIVYVFIAYYKYYKVWRENRDAKLNAIENNKATIAKNEKRIDTLRSHAFSAWKTINSLVICQSKLMKIYTNFINLINNLRTWYKEINVQNANIEINSCFPNITIMDKDLIDRYFEGNICNTEICRVNLCRDIESHVITVDYLACYKDDLKKDLEKKIFSHLDSISFNIPDHIKNNSFSNLAIPITDSVFNDWSRRASLFLHINSVERGVVPMSHYVFAYNTEGAHKQLSSRFNQIYPVMLNSNDRYKLTLLTVAPLKFEECVMFQNNGA